MDPVSLVVAAVVLGASAGLTDTATMAVKDAYDVLKKMLTRRKVDIAQISAEPHSESERESLRVALNQLDGTGVRAEDELVDAARKVTDAVHERQPEIAVAMGIDLARVKVGFIEVDSIRSSGTAFRLVDGEVSGGIRIGRISAGGGESSETTGNEDPSKR